MSRFLSLLLLLPLFEVIGFFVVCDEIGFFYSILWIWGSTMLGFYLLRHGGSTAWRRRKEQGDDVFQAEDAFDSLCVMIAAILLIFPGFISDFIAVPFLLAPFRHWLFGRAKSDPNNFVRKGYRNWSDTRPGSTAPPPVIDGEFRRVDDKPQLPES